MSLQVFFSWFMFMLSCVMFHSAMPVWIYTLRVRMCPLVRNVIGVYVFPGSCAQFFLTAYETVVVVAVDGDGDDIGGISSGVDRGDVVDGAEAGGMIVVVFVVVIMSNNVPS